MSALEVLPMVVVMVAGPQFLSALFLATSEGWRRNVAAYVAGAALSIPAVVAVGYVLGIGVGGGSGPVRDAVVLLALALAMLHAYRTRADSEPPRWMGALESASPRFSFRLGFLLLGFFPTDVFAATAVGSYLAAGGAPLADAIPFVLLTLFVLALPGLALAVAGDRAEVALPAVRDWTTDHAWLVSEAVLGLFVAMTLRNAFG